MAVIGCVDKLDMEMIGNDNEYIFHEGLLVQVTDEDCNRHDIICEYNFTMLLSRLTNT